MPRVGIIIGSKSDESVMQETLNLLISLGIDAEIMVASAHRNPERVKHYVEEASSRGIEVFIAAAGGAAALPGVVAAHTTLPVIGVPLASSELRGVDAMHSIVMMPPGIPVACVAVGSWGARNAALLAAQILGLKYEKVRAAHDEYRRQLQEK